MRRSGSPSIVYSDTQLEAALSTRLLVKKFRAGFMMQRRWFGSLSLAWVLPSSVLADRADPLSSLLARLTAEQSTVARLGHAYLAVADVGRLAATEVRLRRAADGGVDGLRRVVATLARADLARGNTVLVDGWVLARTEAEVLALTAYHRVWAC